MPLSVLCKSRPVVSIGTNSQNAISEVQFKDFVQRDWPAHKLLSDGLGTLLSKGWIFLTGKFWALCDHLRRLKHASFCLPMILSSQSVCSSVALSKISMLRGLVGADDPDNKWPKSCSSAPNVRLLATINGVTVRRNYCNQCIFRRYAPDKNPKSCSCPIC
jgi:hypothetical protein